MIQKKLRNDSDIDNKGINSNNITNNNRLLYDYYTRLQTYRRSKWMYYYKWYKNFSKFTSKLINLSTDSDKDDNGVINSNVNRLLYNWVELVEFNAPPDTILVISEAELLYNYYYG